MEEESHKITVTKAEKVKDPRRVEQGKRLTAISLEGKGAQGKRARAARGERVTKTSVDHPGDRHHCAGWWWVLLLHQGGRERRGITKASAYEKGKKGSFKVNVQTVSPVE